MYAASATHDKKLISAALSIISEKKIDRSKYEFQMLYGVTPDLRRSVVEKGHTMRVYVPYGKDWYNYSTRRLRENPQMVSHIIKALFVRG
jgi:proline dehydrogenase